MKGDASFFRNIDCVRKISIIIEKIQMSVIVILTSVRYNFNMSALTQKQIEVLKFIISFTKEKGYPPSIREIGTAFQIAPPSVLDHLRALEKKGFIRRLPFKPRCLEVLKQSRDEAA